MYVPILILLFLNKKLICFEKQLTQYIKKLCTKHINILKQLFFIHLIHSTVLDL